MPSPAGATRSAATSADPGDLFVARFRLGLLLLLTLVPLSTLAGQPRRRSRTGSGLASIGVALAFAVWFERLAARDLPPSWLGFATSQFDIAVISLGFVSFLIAGRPIVATNSLVHYTMYFVALAGTGLRYDPRVCLAAGRVRRCSQYGAIVTWWAGTSRRCGPWIRSTAPSSGTRR